MAYKFDNVAAAVSNRMKSIKGKNTKPEIIVRRIAHHLGYRFRLHRKDLPGSPDLVFPSRKKIIFVHGCFWHQHDCNIGSRSIKTRSEYWKLKFDRNRIRDDQKEAELRRLGWATLVIWECELKDDALLRAKIHSFLGPREVRE